MARINKISITLCALLFTSISFTPLSHASQQARSSSAQKAHPVKSSERKKKTSQKTKTTAKTTSKTSTKTSAKKKTTASSKASSSTHKSASSTHKGSKQQTAAAKVTQKCTVTKGHKKKCVKVVDDKPLKVADVHKAKVQKAQKTAMNKLMNQIGKPYRWGGTSPRTGFDCSGLVYYAYKDLVNIRIPRTANEMYHLRDARPVNRSELESGDLVFFRTRGRGTADHVGVYVGNGKFIQSPRTGRDIQVTSLSEDYWTRHYVGARRVMTPKTIR
ncbi:C40 family peptidase [Yokenella regensburgei]|uniref:C40 family peptidase n=1 Tax=Yokenella regensburgei TaxID=158877 RepID=UPI001375FFA8|nr:C40 family peptidase [Yokenella regensburgei]QIU89036.1 C40 family peptidase [Yokenella regensburgei]